MRKAVLSTASKIKDAARKAKAVARRKKLKTKLKNEKPQKLKTKPAPPIKEVRTRAKKSLKNQKPVTKKSKREKDLDQLMRDLDAEQKRMEASGEWDKLPGVSQRSLNNALRTFDKVANKRKKGRFHWRGPISGARARRISKNKK